MSLSTQLLCTFCGVDDVEAVVVKIGATYDVAFGTIYILQNVDSPADLCCTYNINVASLLGEAIPKDTVTLHRKKATNTLYTINALNMLVSELNGGKIDRNFKVDWTDYRNMILITAYNRLKKINTKLLRIENVSTSK